MPFFDDFLEFFKNILFFYCFWKKFLKILNMAKVFSFIADDGMAEDNPTYHFSYRVSNRKVTKKGKRGGNLVINESYFVFDAVGYTNGEGIDYALKTKVISNHTAKVMRENIGYYKVINLCSFRVGNHVINCPKEWQHKIQKQITENALEIFLNSNDDDPF
jgi:hypothetical protein